MKEIIKTTKAPKPVGPYSPVVGFGDLLFLSGQGPLDPATGEKLPGDIGEETRQTLDNIKSILEDLGSSMEEVLKVTVYLADMEDYVAFNQVYAGFFPSRPPARTCVQAGRLPLDFKVEIDIIAGRGKRL